MKVVAGLALLLVSVRLSCGCSGEGDILFCSSIPQAFPPGFSFVLVSVKNIGEISATMFQSENLTSVTRLRMEDAGVTGIAEGAFSSLRSLTNLSLTQNLLTEFNPKWFSQPEVLSELYLTENRIQALNEVMFHGLSGLTKLSLNKNRIKTIDVNSFRTQTALAQLDLSDNKMTQVSPQVFKFFKTAKFRLRGNPWNCYCGAESFVNFLKDLQGKSLLEEPAEVKCESPVSLRGRPVWNVSACETAPGSAQPEPTGVLTSFPTSPVVTTLTSQATSEAHPSVQPIATDAATEMSSHTVGTEFSVHPKPSDQPEHHTHLPAGLTDAAAQPLGSNTVCTLVAVIVVLSLLLILVCCLVVLHRRNRSNETVTPECSKENRDELKEDGSRSSHVQSLEHAEEGNNWDSELGWGRCFGGVRAKSANAVLFTSPFFLTGKDKVAEAELQSNKTGNPLQGSQELESPTEGNAGFETNRLKKTTDASDGEDADGVCQDKGNSCVVVNADTVPYLSIGANQNQPEESINQSTTRAAHSSQMGKMLARVSTWPPTAVQWQARCKAMEVREEEEEREESGPVWAAMFSTEMNKGLRPVGDPPEDFLNAIQCSRPKDKDDEESQDHTEVNQEQQLKKEGKMIQDLDTAGQTMNGSRGLREEIHGREKQMKPAEKSNKKTESPPAVTSRQQTGSRSTGSKAPSGGTSPDDETLLSGNEYAFMDLLHEVAQNNGRWTRERWRQRHANKQRR
ncbi:uncharacterized protein V6R79_024616 [Siganus canaliculatus]